MAEVGTQHDYQGGQMHHHLGVDITLGFTGSPYTHEYSATWEEYFYLYAISEFEWSVQTAAEHAREAVLDEHGGYYGYDTFQVYGTGNESLSPARYGAGTW